jgi:hypothetical protein
MSSFIRGVKFSLAQKPKERVLFFLDSLVPFLIKKKGKREILHYVQNDPTTLCELHWASKARLPRFQRRSSSYAGLVARNDNVINLKLEIFNL